MTYSIKNSNVIFERDKQGCIVNFVIMIGSIFFIIGCCLLKFSNDNEMPFAVFKYLFPAMGLIVIWSGINLPKTLKKNTPDQIIFDNQKGVISVLQSASEITDAKIYYDEIEGFTVHIKTHRSSSSSRSSSRTYYTYEVCLLKKDLSTWELMSENTQENADKEIAKLKLLIDFSVIPTKENVKITQSKKFEILKNNDKTTLNWVNDIGYQPLFYGIFIIFFLGIGYTIFNGFISSNNGKTGADGFSIAFGLVSIFILSVFIYIISTLIYKLIKNATTNYSISISKTNLEYFEKSKTGNIKKTVSFAKETIHAISYSFDSSDTSRFIYVFTHDQFQKKKDLKLKLSIDSIKDYYQFHQNLLAIELQNLSPVEALYIENFLQNQVENCL